MFRNLILLERPFRLLGKGVYLKGLTVFSRQLKDKILKNRRKNTLVLTPGYLRATRFREIASALEKKNVSEIKFSVSDSAILGDPEARSQILNRSIRVAIRELATHGIRNQQLKCKITVNSTEGRNVKAYITIDPAKNAIQRADVTIKIGFNQ